MNRFMSKIFKLNQVSSNLIFLFPIITSYLRRDRIYFLLSIMIIIASTCYHFFKETNRNAFYLKYLLFADTCIAYTSYIYMFYFVHRLNSKNQFLLCTLLTLSIFVYLLGERRFAKKYDIHSYFHLVIGIVSGIIPLFA